LIKIKSRDFIVLYLSQIDVVVLIVKFIIVVVVAVGALANLLTISVKPSHDLFHIDVHRRIIQHVIIIIYRPSVTTQTFRIIFVATVEFALAKSFPIVVLKYFRCILR
jgi:hypothetical protein